MKTCSDFLFASFYQGTPLYIFRILTNNHKLALTVIASKRGLNINVNKTKISIFKKLKTQDKFAWNIYRC